MGAHFFLARCHTLHHIAHVMTTQTANGHGASAVRIPCDLPDNVVDSVHALYWSARFALDILRDNVDRETFAPRAVEQLSRALRHADRAEVLNVIL